MVARKSRSYTAEQREAGLADVRAHGVVVAARQHTVPQSCVSRWASMAGVTRSEGDGQATTGDAAVTPRRRMMRPVRRETSERRPS